MLAGQVLQAPLGIRPDHHLLVVVADDLQATAQTVMTTISRPSPHTVMTTISGSTSFWRMPSRAMRVPVMLAGQVLQAPW